MYIFLISVFSLIGYFTHRFYKKIARRCDKCGSIFGVLRKHFIDLPTGTVITYHLLLERKWFLRGVGSVTHSVCKKCKHERIDKVSNGPMSVLHLLWVRKFHPEQFRDDGTVNRLISSLWRKSARVRDVSGSKSPHGETDQNPPINILREFFDLLRLVSDQFVGGDKV